MAKFLVELSRRSNLAQTTLILARCVFMDSSVILDLSYARHSYKRDQIKVK